MQCAKTKLVADVVENIGLQFSSWCSIHLLLHRLYIFYYQINSICKCVIIESNVLPRSVSSWDLSCKIFLYSFRNQSYVFDDVRNKLVSTHCTVTSNFLTAFPIFRGLIMKSKLNGRLLKTDWKMKQKNGWKMIISNKISIHFENCMKNRLYKDCLFVKNVGRYRAVKLSYCQSIGMSVHRYASKGLGEELVLFNTLVFTASPRNIKFCKNRRRIRQVRIQAWVHRCPPPP